jgi:hypothetical protein
MDQSFPATCIYRDNCGLSFHRASNDILFLTKPQFAGDALVGCGDAGTKKPRTMPGL